ncbi:MAG TPA: hypothetical protein VNM37_11145, partial [Candidatus Dormibacteraeota bacterium]|nr:hypothetical protein [Candidatus Dormibacteraeota bacterium]
TQARSLEATSIRILATSAARDALNAVELVSAIRQASGHDTEIISGEQEADLAFRGVTTDTTLLQVPLLLLDVGGGSTEFILGRRDAVHFRQSLPLGTVRLLENLPHSDPPGPEELVSYRTWVTGFLLTKVRPELAPALTCEKSRCPPGSAIQLVGTGGTATVLAMMEAKMKAFDRALIEALRLDRQRLDWHVDFLWRLSLAERRQITGLPPNRADVILAGSVIYQAIMTQFDFPQLRITTRGLRFAALMG